MDLIRLLDAFSMRGLPVALLLIGTISALALPGPASVAHDTISVDGNCRIEAGTVQSYFHPDRDGQYDAAALDAGLKALVATGLFDHVTVERAGARIIIHLSEAKVLDRVAFEGNRKVKDADLAAVVRSKPGGGFQRATVQEDIGRIIDAYHRAGRDDVRVAPEIIERGNARVDLVYTITEGKKTPVRRIDFVGNRAFGAQQLRAVIKTSASNVLSFLTGGDVYDADRLNDDRETLRQYYRNHGFVDATVTKAAAEFDPVANGFNVTFGIDEGPPYRFGNIDLACNVPGLDCNRIRGQILIRSDAMFDASRLDRSTEALTTEMAKLGLPFAQADARITADRESGRADIIFAVQQGRRAYIERIEIHGNNRTRDYVIRREFDVAEGDAYNKTLIERAERRLKNLNYFKSVKISTRPGSAADRVVLDVETAEQSTGDFNISGGYSSTDGLLAEVKVGDRNVLGSGNAVQTSVTYGQYARGANISLSSPYASGRATAEADLFYRQSSISPSQSYGSDRYGGTFALGTPVNEQASILWRYSLYDQQVTLPPNASGASASIPVRQAAAAGRQLVSAAGQTVTYTTLDNNQNPTSGVRSQLSQDLAGLGGDVRFLRTTEDVRYYQSLSRDVTGLLRAQGGYITGWGGQQAPLLNSFFGGPSMVRGFAPNGFGPRDLTAGSTMDNVGGSLFWATTAELQSNIPGLPQEYRLKASAFVDAGSVFGYRGPSQSVQVASKNVLRSSAGVGLSWASPFGPLAVDYAVPLSKSANDSVQPLNFSAGGF